jgi:hypothetical protein
MRRNQPQVLDGLVSLWPNEMFRGFMRAPSGQ